MIDFPVGTTVGQEFTSGSSTWVWDGAKWMPKAGSGGGGDGGITVEADPLSLHLTGGTLTGNVNGTSATFTEAVRFQGNEAGLNPDFGQIQIDDPIGDYGCWINGSRLGSPRWGLALGDETPQAANNSGYDFRIIRYSNAGAYIDTPFGIARSNGCGGFDSGLVVHGADQSWTTLDALQMGNPTPGPDYDWTGMFYTGTSGPDWDGEVGYLNTLSWAGSCTDAAGNFHYGGGTGRAYKVQGGTWTSSSDARIKTVQSEYALGLDAVLALRPVVYTYIGNDTPSANVMVHKGEKERPDAKPVSSAPYPASDHKAVAEAQTPFVGLIAQEVELVMPGMVGTRPGYIDGVATDIKTLDTSELLYALVNAVKDLAAQNAALTERINILEGGA